MRKNECAAVTVTDMSDLGYGVGHIDGKVVLVKNAVTRDELRVKIIKDGGSYYAALIEEILSPSPLRAEPLCPVFPKCGGCSFCHIGYDYEKELKRGFVSSFLRKEGLTDLAVLPVLSAEKVYGYRNKVQYPCRGGEIGYYAGHSHRIVPFARCALHHPAMQPVLDALCGFIKKEEISCYDEESGRGLLRHLCLRTNASGGQMLLTLVLNGRSFPKTKELLALLRGYPAVTGLFYNVNKEQTNVIMGEEFIHVWGKDTLTDELLGCSFEISPASFYQVNHDACELLYKQVIGFADLRGGETVADLFCGAGTIGITLAKHAPVGRLIGIEIVPQAVENAKKNAERSGVLNAEFYAGDANHPSLAHADVVIVDPPRKGLDETLIAQLSELETLNRIVYVSCNPATLARDLHRFRERGWWIGELQPVDMFPRTGHVETVVLLSRKNIDDRLEFTWTDKDFGTIGSGAAYPGKNAEKRE